MPKTYCPTCGAGTEYSLSAPKFCSNCGGGFTVSFTLANSPRPGKPPLSRQQAVIDGDDEEYYEEQPARRLKFPKKLDITVEGLEEFKLHKEPLASLGAPLGLGSRPVEKLGKRARKENNST